MADVTEEVRHDIDDLLERTVYEWQRLPIVAQTIGQWEPIDRLVFIEEWPIQEDNLWFLDQYAAKGMLTAEQRARLEHLKGIVEQNRPIIDALRRR